MKTAYRSYQADKGQDNAMEHEKLINTIILTEEPKKPKDSTKKLASSPRTTEAGLPS